MEILEKKAMLLFQGMRKVFGDKGYISAEIATKLFERGLKLFTTLRNKMKNK